MSASPPLSTPPAPSAPAPPPPPALVEAKASRRRQLPIFFWALVAVALLLAYNALFARTFFHLQVIDGRLVGSLVDVFHRGSQVMLLSLGMTMIIATGGIDLSVGSIMAIAAAASSILLTDRSVIDSSAVVPHSAAFAIAVALGAGLLAGMWNGTLVSYLGIQPIIATLILMIAGRGVAQLITHNQVPTFHNATFQGLNNGTFLGLPFSLTITALMTLVAVLLTRGTALGLFVESIGNNQAASEVAGIPTRLVKFMTYAFTGLCAAFAGLLACADIGAGDVHKSGLNIELDAIVAVAIGGTSLVGGRFSLIGSLLGALAMQMLKTTVLSSSVPPEFNLVIEAAVVIAICLLQSPRTRSGFARLFRRA